MAERKPEDFCEIEKIQCAVLTLVEQKEKIVLTFLEDAKSSFDKAYTAYHEDEEMIQKEIDSLSKNCVNCPHNSKLLGNKLKKWFDRTSHYQ